MNRIGYWGATFVLGLIGLAGSTSPASATAGHGCHGWPLCHGGYAGRVGSGCHGGWDCHGVVVGHNCHGCHGSWGCHGCHGVVVVEEGCSGEVPIPQQAPAVPTPAAEPAQPTPAQPALPSAAEKSTDAAAAPGRAADGSRPKRRHSAR